ncbi:hypothetical protein CFP56_013670 [Quercus suber]|uniref:Uncharacterized protein n=1 Tax=Quercus suber TaxID=58331 RepID=A0AAW0KSL7_QUESU
MDWILRFPMSRIHHMECFHSDHKSILLISDAEQKRFYRKGGPFIFEAMWLKDKTCENVIKESWANVNDIVLNFPNDMKIILYTGSVDGVGLSKGYGPMGVGPTRL